MAQPHTAAPEDAFSWECCTAAAGTGQDLSGWLRHRLWGEFVGKELQGDEAVEAGVLSFVVLMLIQSPFPGCRALGRAYLSPSGNLALGPGTSVIESARNSATAMVYNLCSISVAVWICPAMVPQVQALREGPNPRFREGDPLKFPKLLGRLAVDWRLTVGPGSQSVTIWLLTACLLAEPAFPGTITGQIQTAT